jgi:hypothetical protein
MPGVDPLQGLEQASIVISSVAGTIEAIRRIHDSYAAQRRPSYNLRHELFPDPRKNIVVTTGRMTTIDSLDPEDQVAAVAALKALDVGKSARGRRSKLVSVDHFPEAGSNTHVIAIGGPLSNKLNSSLAHVAPFAPKSRPLVPLYAHIDPGVAHRVSRKFDGQTHTRPKWSIYDAREDFYLNPQVDQDGWLTRDYLLFSCLPYTKSRVHVSAIGLYGPGVMALSLLVGRKEKALEEVLEQRGRASYFQSLFAVEDIEHRRFSVGKSLRHLITYPIAISGDKTWKLKKVSGNA